MRLTDNCEGVLVTPRLIATAAHCVPHPTAVVGPDFFLATSPRVPIIDCAVHPDALRAVGVVAPTCARMQELSPHRCLPASRSEPRTPWSACVDSYDWAIEVLDRRIDEPGRGTSLVATPASVRCAGPLAAGAALRSASRSHVDASMGRVALGVTLVTDAEMRPFSTFSLPGSSYLDGPYVVVAPARTEPGDSGSPVFLGDPDTGPLTLVSVLSGLYASPTYDPRVRDWLCPMLEPSARLHGVFLGPADYPITGAPGRTPAMDTADPDGDGLVGDHDVCLATFDPDQIDSDRDGVGDACDGCPGLRGGGTDRDHDGHGDSCDLCPDVTSSNNDADGDRIGDECDNCVAVANHLQEDCNVDATETVRRREIVTGGVALTPFAGDMCDPIPCGDTRPVNRTVRVGAERRLRFDRLEVDARVASRSGADGRSGLPGATGMRFCACEFAGADMPGVRGQCAGIAPAARACLLSAVPTYDATRGAGAVEARSWRWITTRTGSSAFATAVDAGFPYQRPVEGSFVADATFEHRLQETDVPRWLAAPVFGADYPTSPGDAAALRGVLWTHTRTLASIPFGTDDVLTTADRQLSSHYWSGSSPAGVTAREPPPCIRPFAPLPADAACPFCGSFFPEIYVGNRGPTPGARCPDASSVLIGIDIGDTRITMPGLDLPIVDPLPLAVDGITWVSVSEPAAVLPMSGLRLVGLAAGTVVSRLAFASPSGLVVTTTDPQGCQTPNCQGPQRLSGASLTEEPSTFDDTTFVLSGRREALFAIGGTREDGSVRTEIDVYAVDGDHWRPLADPTDVLLGRVLAATYSAPDDRLYVLDEVEVHHRALARLLRIDPDGGARTIVERFPRVGRADAFAMATDASGRLYVVASFDRPHDRGVHVVLQLSRSGTPLGIAGGSGALVGAPVHASERGLSVPVTASASPVVLGYRWTDFLGGSGLAERCF